MIIRFIYGFLGVPIAVILGLIVAIIYGLYEGLR